VRKNKCLQSFRQAVNSTKSPLDAEAGKTVSFKDVLACGEGAKVKIGEPHVKGAEVKGEVLEQRKRDKVLVFKKKRRQTYRRKRGHRQNETVVKITSIKA